jgi:hypothetical protein
MRHRGRRALLPLGRAHRTSSGRRRAGPPGRRRWRRGAALTLLLALGTSAGVTGVVVTAGELGRRLAEYTRDGSSDVAAARVTAEPSRSARARPALGTDGTARRPELRRAEQPSSATYSAATIAPPVATQTEEPATRAPAGDPSTEGPEPASAQGGTEGPRSGDGAEPSTPTSEPQPDDDSTPGQGQGPDGDPPSHDPDGGPGNGQGHGPG